MKKNVILITAFFIGAAAYGQVGINTDMPKATLDIVGKPSNILSLDGIIAPRLTGDQLATKTYTAAQTGALVYVIEANANPIGQTENVTSPGYYYFNGTKWIATSSGYKNIYNSNGTFTGNRTANIPSGQWLNFSGEGYVGIGNVDPIAKLNVNGFIQFAQDSDYGVGRIFDNGAGEKYGLTQSTYFPESGAARSAGTRIYTSGKAGVPGHITFGKYTSASNYTEWARFAHSTGNFGINTINATGSNNPTEKLDVNGVARVRALPENGQTNAIHTTVTGTESSAQDQAFTGTRTVVADVNGVLGYVSGLPSVTDPNTQNLTYARKTVSPINASTPTNSVVTIGTLSLRFNGTSANSANMEYNLSTANHVTILYHKGGSGGANLEEWGRQASVANTWYSFNGETGNATRDINPSNRDIAYAIIILHNTKEIYRVTANANGDIPANGSVPAAASSITLFVERLQ